MSLLCLLNECALRFSFRVIDASTICSFARFFIRISDVSSVDAYFPHQTMCFPREVLNGLSKSFNRLRIAKFLRLPRHLSALRRASTLIFILAASAVGYLLC